MSLLYRAAGPMCRTAPAHAWVEYYLDGFGWLPLEATPGFARETSVLPEGIAFR